MKKYILGALLLASPLTGFCSQRQWVCDGYSVSQNVAQLRASGHHVYSVTCRNPEAPKAQQHWIIIWEYDL
jgi:hypothetical protein